MGSPACRGGGRKRASGQRASCTAAPGRTRSGAHHGGPPCAKPTWLRVHVPTCWFCRTVRHRGAHVIGVGVGAAGQEVIDGAAAGNLVRRPGRGHRRQRSGGLASGRSAPPWSGYRVRGDLEGGDALDGQPVCLAPDAKRTHGTLVDVERVLVGQRSGEVLPQSEPRPARLPR